jgi:peptidoglycan hydrolase-like protein with peptidoglycan-binding domain
MGCHCYASNGVCSDFVPKSANYDDIKFPVGAIEGKRSNGNHPDDVRTIQKLMNLIPHIEGAPVYDLAVDGICGPLTRGAIKSFQLKQFPNKTPDVIVDTDQTTLYRMNEIAYPFEDKVLLDTARASLSLVAGYISRTLVDISLIKAAWSNPNALFRRETEIARLNYHFHLDRSNDRLRDLEYIRRTFQDMLTVCGHVPGGPNQKPAWGFLDLRPHEADGEVYYAWCYGGGWKHFQGRTGHSRKLHMDIRADQIYLTRKLLTANNGAIGYAISHELAHYVGGLDKTVDHIADHVYYHRNTKKYEALSSREAIRNADSYSQYNWEVNRGYKFQP